MQTSDGREAELPARTGQAHAEAEFDIPGSENDGGGSDLLNDESANSIAFAEGPGLFGRE